MGDLERPARPADAAEVVWAYLAKQAATVDAYADEVRADGPDAVHKSRVAARRSRGVMKTYRDVLDRDEARRLSSEFKWLGDKLGAPRDAEVIRDYLLASVDAMEEADLHGPVVERLRDHLNAEHAAAHALLVEALDSRRYERLRRRLDDQLRRRPHSEEGKRPAHRVLPGLLADAAGRVRRLRDAAAERPEHLEGWHDVRKAAKAVRYSAEALADAFGDPAAELAARWEAVTERFGVFQDSVVAADVLAERAWVAELAGEPVHTYTILGERELERRLEALRTGRKALDEALAVDASLLGVPDDRPVAADPA